MTATIPRVLDDPLWSVSHNDDGTEKRPTFPDSRLAATWASPASGIASGQFQDLHWDIVQESSGSDLRITPGDDTTFDILTAGVYALGVYVVADGTFVQSYVQAIGFVPFTNTSTGLFPSSSGQSAGLLASIYRVPPTTVGTLRVFGNTSSGTWGIAAVQLTVQRLA